jgi:hypothetical protein
MTRVEATFGGAQQGLGLCCDAKKGARGTMARLALAAIFVLVVVGVAAVFLAGLRSIRQSQGTGGALVVTEGTPMQKVSFFLLIALIFYVSASGGA